VRDVLQRLRPWHRHRPAAMGLLSQLARYPQFLSPPNSFDHFHVLIRGVLNSFFDVHFLSF
jgi:hypothetical protein